MAASKHYNAYPSDYVGRLKRHGKRKKAMAFMDYFDDTQAKVDCAVSFYAEAWGVAKSTAWSWIQEFKEEIEKFTAYWQIRNAQKESQKNFVRTNAERLPNDFEESDKAKTTENRELEDLSKKLIERSPNEVLNIYDDDRPLGYLFDPDFNDLFFTYRQNYRFAGNKEESYKEYLRVKGKVKHEDLKRAIVLYLQDPEVEKRYNFKNFLKNEVFYSYMPKRLKLKVKGEWKTGVYDDANQVFKADDGFVGFLSPTCFAELFKNKEAELIR